MELYAQAVQNGGGKTPKAVTAGNGGTGELSLEKMTPAEKKKEIARRRAIAQKEKVLLPPKRHHMRTSTSTSALLACEDKRVLNRTTYEFLCSPPESDGILSIIMFVCSILPCSCHSLRFTRSSFVFSYRCDTYFFMVTSSLPFLNN